MVPFFVGFFLQWLQTAGWKIYNPYKRFEPS